MPFDIFEPRHLAAVLQRNPAAPTFLRDTLFRDRVEYPTKHIDFDIVKGSRKVAPFVNPKVGGKVLVNEGYETKTYTAPMVAPAKNINVEDLDDRLPGESLTSTQTPAQRSIRIIGNDLREMDTYITRREEVMCAEALFTGKINVKGDNINEVINFGTTQKEELTKKWGTEAADPLGDLARWKKTIHEKGLVSPDIVIMDSVAVAAFINTPAVKELLDIRNIELAKINPREITAGVSYIGVIPSMNLSIYSYDETYLDDWTSPKTPVTKPFVPEGTVCMASTNARFSMLYGAVSYFDDDRKAHTVIGRRVPISDITPNRLNRTTTLYSRPLAVPHELNSWFVAKVV